MPDIPPHDTPAPADASSTALPPRSNDAEDRFIASWRDADDLRPLIPLVEIALDARRPRLAARIVGLLPDEGDDAEGTPIRRARHAARMLLLAPRGRNGDWEDALLAEWKEARRAFMGHIRRRMRRPLEKGPRRRVPRASRYQR